jgi:hypothetical protein
MRKLHARVNEIEAQAHTDDVHIDRFGAYRLKGKIRCAVTEKELKAEFTKIIRPCFMELYNRFPTVDEIECIYQRLSSSYPQGATEDEVVDIFDNALAGFSPKHP